MIRVIMHGCNGKMGQVITNLIDNEDDMEIVAGIDKYNVTKNDYPVFEDCKSCDIEADVVIDFSNAQAADALLDYCAEKQLPVVMCTTGLSKEQLDKVSETAKETAVLRSANMSLGINLLIKLIGEAAKTLNAAGFDIEIVERHHNQKIDAPSGTAIALADAANAAIKENTGEDYSYNYDRSKVREKRLKNEIGISAVRGGTIVGDHEIIFAGIDEVIEFKHQAFSKAVFGKGAVEAAKVIYKKPAGLYSMKDVL
jgi:4-hydroxy-tetrahydrodipicolinate reductase